MKDEKELRLKIKEKSLKRLNCFKSWSNENESISLQQELLKNTCMFLIDEEPTDFPPDKIAELALLKDKCDTLEMFSRCIDNYITGLMDAAVSKVKYFPLLLIHSFLEYLCRGDAESFKDEMKEWHATFWDDYCVYEKKKLQHAL